MEEAVKHRIYTQRDLILLTHEEYEEKWNKYCDEYFRINSSDRAEKQGE